MQHTAGCPLPGFVGGRAPIVTGGQCGREAGADSRGTWLHAKRTPDNNPVVVDEGGLSATHGKRDGHPGPRLCCAHGARCVLPWALHSGLRQEAGRKGSQSTSHLRQRLGDPSATRHLRRCRGLAERLQSPARAHADLCACSQERPFSPLVEEVPGPMKAAGCKHFCVCARQRLSCFYSKHWDCWVKNNDFIKKWERNFFSP